MTKASFSLVQATKDLENYDAERHEEFKRYEMLKEHERREYLKGLDQEKRDKEEKRMQELMEKHRQHPKVNAPVRTYARRHRQPGGGGGVSRCLTLSRWSVSSCRGAWPS